MTVKLSEAQHFLEVKSKYYLELEGHILQHLRPLITSPSYSETVYRIYTRLDKQRTSALKDPVRMIDSLKRRLARRSIKSSINRPLFLQLPDIVGITVVVAYPSDVDEVCTFINDAIALKKLKSYVYEKRNGKVIHGRLMKSDGYQAYHFVVGIDNNPYYRDMRCEIQIKTILHDAWAAKTHDLTYKRYSFINDNIIEQFRLLSNNLSSLDHHSELIKDMIYKEWFADNQRKTKARHTLLSRVPTEEDPKLIMRYNDIRDEVVTITEQLNNQEENRSGSQMSELEDRIEHQIENFSKIGSPLSACNLLTFAAVLWGSDKLKELAISRIDDWILCTGDTTERFRAHAYKSYALYVMGLIKDAIDVGEEAIDKYKDKYRNDDPKVQIAIRLHNNLAYSYAELGETDVGERLNAEQRANQHIMQADELRQAIESDFEVGETRRGFHIDTRGFIKIKFGRTKEEIYEGLKLCELSIEQVPESLKDGQRFFFELHRREAMRKILRVEDDE